MGVNFIEFEKKNMALAALKFMATGGRLSGRDVLQKFYEQIDDVAISSDLLPTTADVYKNILLQLPGAEVKQSLGYMFRKYPQICLRDSGLLFIITKHHPQITTWVFDEVANSMLLSTNNEYLDKATGALSMIILGAADGPICNQLVDKWLRLPMFLHDGIYDNIEKAYRNIPDVREKIVRAVINGQQDDAPVNLILKMLGKLTPFLPITLDFVEKNLDDLINDADSVFQALDIVAYFHLKKYDISRTTKILNKIKQSPQARDIDVLRKIARTDNTVVAPDILRSFAYFGERVPKSETTPNAWKQIAGIAPDENCVLVLGGNLTVTETRANGYLKRIEELFQSRDITSVGLYAVYNDFGEWRDNLYSFDNAAARRIQMKKYGRHVKNAQSLSYDDVDPQYIKQIFNCIFLPRISDNGKKIDAKIAAIRLRKITVVAHCHGGYSFIALEEMMQQRMRDMGYSKSESEYIQKQLLCIAYAPYCPLGVSKSTMLSFMSATDSEIHSFNMFEQVLRTMGPDRLQKLAYFPDTLGNVFIAPRVVADNVSWGDEHTFYGFNAESGDWSESGKTMIKFAANALANGVAGKPIISVKDLVANGDKQLESEFDNALNYGKEVYSEIVSQSIARHKKTRE